MQRRNCLAPFRRASGIAAVVLGLCAGGIVPGAAARADQATADRANGIAHEVQPSYARAIRSAEDQPLFRLDYLRQRNTKDCQVPLPPIGAVSPFPVALRLGALLSPTTAFDGGIDVTIPGIHLFQGFSTRIDADVIVVQDGFFGVSALVPVTFDQIYNLNLPVSTRVYIGGGIGPYFSTSTRFGGKLIVGAQFSRIGLEGNVHFAGVGDPLFTLQLRIGL